MNNMMSLIMSLIFGFALTLVVGFVVSSIKGFNYDFGAAIPYGLVIGLIVYIFGTLITAEGK